MPDDIVYSIAVERTGIIWAGTSVEGVVRIDEPLFVPALEIASRPGVQDLPESGEGSFHHYICSNRCAFLSESSILPARLC